MRFHLVHKYETYEYDPDGVNRNVVVFVFQDSLEYDQNYRNDYIVKFIHAITNKLLRIDKKIGNIRTSIGFYVDGNLYIRSVQHYVVTNPPRVRDISLDKWDKNKKLISCSRRNQSLKQIILE